MPSLTLHTSPLFCCHFFIIIPVPTWLSILHSFSLHDAPHTWSQALKHTHRHKHTHTSSSTHTCPHNHTQTHTHTDPPNYKTHTHTHTHTHNHLINLLFFCCSFTGSPVWRPQYITAGRKVAPTVCALGGTWKGWSSLLSHRNTHSHKYTLT